MRLGMALLLGLVVAAPVTAALEGLVPTVGVHEQLHCEFAYAEGRLDEGPCRVDFRADGSAAAVSGAGPLEELWDHVRIHAAIAAGLALAAWPWGTIAVLAVVGAVDG